MKKQIIFFSFLIYCSVFSFSQITFQKTYGGPGSDNGYSARQANGGYIVCGMTNSYGFSGPYGDWYLVKADINGSLLWTKTYTEPSYDLNGAWSIAPTSDGGYIVGGMSEDTVSSGPIQIYGRIIKVDALGNVQWAKTRTTSFSYVTDIKQTTDGGYIATGMANDRAYLYKMDSGGNLQWTNEYDGNGKSSVGRCVWQTNDGGYICCGSTTNAPGLGGFEIFVFKTDATGNLQWSKAIGGGIGTDDQAASCQQTNDGGYIVKGFTNSSIGAGQYDLYLAKLDSVGNLSWAKTYGGSGDEYYYSSSKSVEQTADGGYIACIYTTSFGAGGADILLVKTDFSGNLQWSKTYGTSGGEAPGSVEQTSDLGYIISGTSQGDVYLIKTDSLGYTDTANGCPQISPVPVVGTGGIIVPIGTSYLGIPMINWVPVVSSGGSVTNTLCSQCVVAATVCCPATVCASTNVTLSATGGSAYSWSTGATTSSIPASATATTTYSVIVSDTACTGADTAFVTVTIVPSITASISPNTTICSGQTATLSASGGTPYSWNTGASTGSITVSPTATSNYSVIVGSGSCSDTVSATVTVMPLAVTAGPNSTICTGQVITLTASGGNIYTWNSGNTTSAITVSPSTTTNYTVTVSNGVCSGTAVVAITVSPPPVAIVSAATICSGQAATLTASGGGNYSWSNGQSINPILVSPTSTATYSVIVSIGSCSDTASAIVTVIPSPSVSVSGNTTLCVGDIATLTASGSNNYSWSSGSSATTINVSPSSSTTYTVTTTNGNCTSTTSITVVVSSPPTAAANNVTICDGQSAVLTASGGGTYSWSNGATTSSITIAATATAAASYSVIVSIGSCSDTATATITVNPSPTASAFSNITITQGQSTTLSASGGGTYLWSNGSTQNPITVSPPITTIYCVTVTQNNCSDTACVTVTVEPIDCSYDDDQLFIPDAFSPNGDTKNDNLGVYYPNPSCIKTFMLIIYDRWGEKVFEADNITALWDGTYKGKLMNTAVFVYYMKVTFITGNETVRKGNISLIR